MFPTVKILRQNSMLIKQQVCIPTIVYMELPYLRPSEQLQTVFVLKDNTGTLAFLRLFIWSPSQLVKKIDFDFEFRVCQSTEYIRLKRSNFQKMWNGEWIEEEGGGEGLIWKIWIIEMLGIRCWFYQISWLIDDNKNDEGTQSRKVA